jgi:hypothetical protein
LWLAIFIPTAVFVTVLSGKNEKQPKNNCFETVPPFIKQKCAMLMFEVIKFYHFATKNQYLDIHLKICQNR